MPRPNLRQNGVSETAAFHFPLAFVPGNGVLWEAVEEWVLQAELRRTGRFGAEERHAVLMEVLG